jgi:hypothetical protein
VISAVKGLMIFCALSFEHVFKSLFFLWREFFVVCEECKRQKKSFWTERRGEGCWWEKVKLVSYHVVHLDYYIG